MIFNLERAFYARGRWKGKLATPFFRRGEQQPPRERDIGHDDTNDGAPVTAFDLRHNFRRERKAYLCSASRQDSSDAKIPR